MTDMEIETFLTVLRSGSMTAAAQALYITQPTLSARLQTLEDEVGTPLFVRGKGLRRLELTEAGTRFLPLAQRWQRLMAEMHGIAAAEARTHFRIGAAYTANQYVLPPVYKRFLERDLPVALRVETLSSQQAQEAVTRRELDMAIVEDDVGFNPLYLYVQGDILAVLLGMSGISAFMYMDLFRSVFGDFGGSLAWAIFFVVLNWIPGYFLYKKKIYIKL